MVVVEEFEGMLMMIEFWILIGVVAVSFDGGDESWV